MKVAAVITLFASITAALPADIQARQTVGSTSNDFSSSKCWDILLVFARGSTEIGNMGTIIGPPLANDLRAKFPSGSIGVQGVNYAALLTTNFIPTGGDPQGEADMANTITTTASKCPDTIIVAGGYSQGAAIAADVLSGISASARAKVAGTVLFGDTQYLQDGGRIPNYSTTNTKIYCALGDLVCDGTLVITVAHLSYGDDASSAASFLAGRIQAAQ